MPKRALISVSDKAGIAEFAKRLSASGWEILSTGGTADVIRAGGTKVTDVAEVTQFPECFGGRVKTMHPLIMGGVLMRRGKDDSDAQKLGIEPIDMVVVNLYPFEDTAKSYKLKAKSYEELIEQIDIGGPTLLRSAAKNYKDVTVITDVDDYARVLEEIESNGDTSLDLRSELATKVFLRTAAYDSAILEALSEGKSKGSMVVNGIDLRYGENPHQWGRFYERYGESAGWTVLQEEKK